MLLLLTSIFAIFQDLVFTSLFSYMYLHVEDVYIRNYKFYLDWPLKPTMSIVHPETKIDLFHF